MVGGDCAIRRSGRSNSKSLFFTLVSTRPAGITPEFILPAMPQVSLCLKNQTNTQHFGCGHYNRRDDASLTRDWSRGFHGKAQRERSEARKQSVTSTAGPSVPRAPGLFYILAISIARTSAILPILLCRGGGTGRRAGFKIRFLHGSAGSIPALGTIQKTSSL